MSRSVTFSDNAWADYTYWQETDRRTAKKINALIKECQRTPETGAGRPEQLRFEFNGWWSRRIDDEHRLVYRFDDDTVQIAQCRYHYKKS